MLFWKKEENGQAKILEAKTVENGCFIETGNEWERIQYAKEIVERAVNLLDYFLEKYPHVERIGLTGQMHGIVYLNAEGRSVSPLYTWQDGSGEIPLEDGRTCVEILSLLSDLTWRQAGDALTCRDRSFCMRL